MRREEEEKEKSKIERKKERRRVGEKRGEKKRGGKKEERKNDRRENKREEKNMLHRVVNLSMAIWPSAWYVNAITAVLLRQACLGLTLHALQ